MSALQVDVNGNLCVNVKVGGGGGTIGTVTQGNKGTIAQSWYVQLTDGSAALGTDANPLRIDPTGTTVQPVVLNTVRDLVGTLILSNDSHTSAQNFGSAGSTGVYLDITTFVVTNRSATATVVTLGDGTNNYTYAIAANGGIVINFPTPLPASSTATQWTVLNSAGVACDYMAVTVANK
jgi:hypothetical protein